MTNVVLIHGAWHGAWCWDAVVNELQARGVSALAVELPLTSFADDVASARDAIQSINSDVVVCAHSYGGFVVTQAAQDLVAVKRLVYLAAFQPDEGEEIMSLSTENPSPLLTALIFGPDSLTVDPARAHEVFYEDSDPALSEDIGARLRPMPLQDLVVLSGPPAWRSIPSTYVVCAHDKAISPITQRIMAARATDVVEWDTDHSPFLTRPTMVADLVIQPLGDR